MTEIAPYGSWVSPITVESLTAQVVRLEAPLAGDGCRYWVETRPGEQGRSVIVRQAGADDRGNDVLAAGVSARTLVHEYGGLCYAVHGDAVYYSDAKDQCLYRTDGTGAAQPRRLTPVPAVARAVRYAAPVVHPDGTWLVAVRERHGVDGVAGAEGVVNDLVAVATAGGSDAVLLAGGHDFFSWPVISPDGRRLAWVSWDHPDMPWDATELWVADLEGTTLSSVTRVAGGPDQSVTAPRFSPEGVLHFVSDRSGWWNLYHEGPAGDRAGAVALCQRPGEFALPDWVFGRATYAFGPRGSLVAVCHEGGEDRLGLVAGGTFAPLGLPLTEIEWVSPSPLGVLAVAGSSTSPRAVVEVALGPGGTEPGPLAVRRRSRTVAVGSGDLSVPEVVEFPTTGGRTAFALFYPPANAGTRAPDGERPPLVVMSHGGPTAATSPVLNFAVQFWTSRGLAVVDVDYGGSTGHGRDYRRRLRGNWGVVDLDDCVAAAEYLASRGAVDPGRMVIRGQSAGGYTTLCALTFRHVFAAGASHYGVGDLGALARATHKFEARYMDSLVGPWPEARQRYEERSPLLHAGQLTTPTILLQGLDDPIVPPEQAETMVAALARGGIPHAYVSFEGEQHGFRQAANIQRAAEAELSFYGQILGFTPADDLVPVEIRSAG